MYRVQSYAVRHKGESGLTAVARLVLVTPLTGPEVVMMEDPMPIRIRHRHKNSVPPQQSDVSLFITDPIPVLQASYTALVAKSVMICGSV
jgi:hypothetical protein